MHVTSTIPWANDRGVQSIPLQLLHVTKQNKNAAFALLSNYIIAAALGRYMCHSSVP
jgi:hypothetical protein